MTLPMATDLHRRGREPAALHASVDATISRITMFWSVSPASRWLLALPRTFAAIASAASLDVYVRSTCVTESSRSSVQSPRTKPGN